MRGKVREERGSKYRKRGKRGKKLKKRLEGKERVC